MGILYLTIFLSLLLAAGFIACFLRTAASREAKSPEQQSLLPLDSDESSSK